MNTLRNLWNRPMGALGLIFLGALLFWGGEYLRRDLWAPDEVRFAYVAREMRDTGNWLVPHRHGEYYAHKPPLMFWMINGAASLFTGGEIQAFATRFPSFLGGVVALWSVVMLIRRWGIPNGDLLAVLACASTYIFWKQGAWGQMDMLLCGLEMLALLALFSQDDRPSFPRAFAAYACMGLAILAKGPVGFLVPLGAYITAKLAAGEKVSLRRSHWIWGPLITLAFPGIWLLLVKLGHPPEGYLNELLFKQNIDRAQGEYGHTAPFYYFLLYFPIDGLPWTLLLPFTWAALGSTPENRILRKRLLGWILFVIFLFSLSPGKRNLYILLAYPAVALMTAAAWSRIPESLAPRRWIRAVSWFPTVLFGILLAGCVASLKLPALTERLQNPDSRFAEKMLKNTRILENIHLVRYILPVSIVFLLFLLLRRISTRRIGNIKALALQWLLLFGATGALILPMFNEHKTPRELIPLVKKYLPEGERLFLYQMNGETLTFHTRTVGEVLNTPNDVQNTLKTHPSGLMVFEKKKFLKLPAALQSRFTQTYFPLGGKEIIAASWPTSLR